jgi:hypothetical protein
MYDMMFLFAACDYKGVTECSYSQLLEANAALMSVLEEELLTKGEGRILTYSACWFS